LRYRRGDPLLLLAFAAFFSRVTTYHRAYDDLIIVLAFPALLNLALGADVPLLRRRVAAVLLLLCWTASLAPAVWSYPDSPWISLFEAIQVSVWLPTLAFLFLELRRQGVQR